MLNDNSSATAALGVGLLIVGMIIGFLIGQNTTCVKLPFSSSTTCVVKTPA